MVSKKQNLNPTNSCVSTELHGKVPFSLPFFSFFHFLFHFRLLLLHHDPMIFKSQSIFTEESSSPCYMKKAKAEPVK
jgi:hypothetical protein